MTAASAFAATKAAYLLTDTAILFPPPSRQVWMFAFKTIESSRLRLAAAITGGANVFQAEDGRKMSPLGNAYSVIEAAPSQDEALAALPEALAKAYDDLTLMSEGAGNFRILIGAWDLAAQESRAYVACSPGALLPERPPFELTRMVSFVGPDVAGELDPENLKESAARMIDAQRRKSWEEGICSIGGQAILTTIDADGVRSEAIHRWPSDRVGRKIDPRPWWKRMI